MKKINNKILWATIEDYVGLWEILWEINTEFPNESNNEKVKRVLLYFLENGLVNFYYDRWGKDELQQIEKIEAIKIIKDERFWKAPKINDLCVKVGSTEKGEIYYEENLI